MKKFFHKQPVWFAVVWIVVYVLAFGNADTISEAIGVPKAVTAAEIYARNGIAMGTMKRDCRAGPMCPALHYCC